MKLLSAVETIQALGLFLLVFLSLFLSLPVVLFAGIVSIPLLGYCAVRNAVLCPLPMNYWTDTYTPGFYYPDRRCVRIRWHAGRCALGNKRWLE